MDPSGGYRRSDGSTWTGSDDKDLAGIPAWNGSAATWRKYRREVATWLEGVQLEVPWSWAARMVRRLSGPARMLADNIDLTELRPIRYGDWNEELDDWANPDPMRGINRLLSALEAIGQTAPMRKGQVMNHFYKHLARRAGEDMQTWVVRFGDARKQLEEEECPCPPGTYLGSSCGYLPLLSLGRFLPLLQTCF